MKIKKILAVVFCIILTFILTVVPCFANTITDYNSSLDYNKYTGIKWSGISLHPGTDFITYLTFIEDFQRFYIDNLDIVNNNNYIYVASDFGVGVNSPYVISDYSQYGEFDVYFRGAYNTGFANGHTFGNSSINNEFYINNIRHWMFNNEYDYYRDVLYINFIVPHGVTYDMINGYADNYLNISFNISGDMLSAYSRGWEHFDNSYDYGMHGYSLSNITMSQPIYQSAIGNSSYDLPNGFELVTITVPMTELLTDYAQDYVTNGNVPLNYQSVFTQNLKIVPTVEWHSNSLDVTLGGLIDNNSANSDDLSLYRGLVNTYNFENFEVLPGRDYNSLPIYSVYSSAPTDRDLDIGIYNSVLKGMGYDNVYVDGNVTSWLGNTLGGIFDIDLFGTVSLGDILVVVLGVALVMMVIKFFAGG